LCPWVAPNIARGCIHRSTLLALGKRLELQQRLFKTGGRLIGHARYFVLQLAESHLTGTLFSEDPRAYRAARLASDVMMLPRAATGRWIIAGSGVSEERSYQRQRLRDMSSRS
jgi:hypothetical protein